MITRITALCNYEAMSHVMQSQPRRTGHGGPFWQNVVHWRRKLQTTSAFLPWYSHEQYEKKKNGVSSNSLFHGVFSTPSGKGNGNALQYSCLESSMNGRAWWATVHGVTKSWKRFHFHFPGGLPHPEIKSKSLHCWTFLYYLSHQGSLALNIATQKCRWK